MFNVFDEDGSNAISRDELGTVMRRLGMSLTNEELKEVIKKHDQDGNPP